MLFFITSNKKLCYDSKDRKLGRKVSEEKKIMILNDIKDGDKEMWKYIRPG